MEAAHIPWRPLGLLLVEQGLLTAAELELALGEQQRTGRRLGETLVACGYVSGPQLANALAAQYGIELTTERGFGTGLRSEIQRRHEHDRRQVLPVPAPPVEAVESDLPEELDEDALLVQLEEQWAKLAAAENELARLTEENEALRSALEARLPAEPAPVDGHVVFAQVPDGYVLVERDGPPPERHEPLLLPGLGPWPFVAGGRRDSPLPGDPRPCVTAVPG